MNDSDKKPIWLKYIGNPVFLLLATIAISGCVGGGTVPSRHVESFILFYPSAAPISQPAVNASLAVERFSADQIIRNGAMVYLPEPFKIDEYVFNRWRMPPGEMVSEFIRRDMREAGIFQGVFGPGDSNTVRYRLSGRVEEFHEVDFNGHSRAVLALQVTLFEDSGEVGGKAAARRIAFQKLYRQSEPMVKASPSALAESMSMAMKRLTSELVSDVSAAVRSSGK